MSSIIRILRRPLAVSLLLVIYYSAAFAIQPPQSDNFTVEIKDISYLGKVVISAVVHDKDGNIVGGLKKDFFTIDVNDKKIPDFSFKQMSDEPISIIFALDVSGSMAGVPMVETKKIVEQFLGYLKEGDYTALLTFGTSVKKVFGFTRDKDIVYGKVDELKANENLTVLFSAVKDAVQLTDTSPTSKSAIVLITDSKDEHSRIDEADALDSVKKSSVPIYTIALGKYKYIDFLKTVSQTSGGKFFLFPKYEDVALLAKTVQSTFGAAYRFEFPFSPGSGKINAAVTLNSSVSAKKEFNIVQEAGPVAVVKAAVSSEHPAGQTFIYALIGLSVLIVMLLLKINASSAKAAQSPVLANLQTQTAAAADSLSKIDSGLKTVLENGMQSAAALSVEIKGVGEHIAALSQQMEVAANSIIDNIADARDALTKETQTQFELGFKGLQTELSTFKDDIAANNAEIANSISSLSISFEQRLSGISEQIESTSKVLQDNVALLIGNLQDTFTLKYDREFSNLKTEITEIEDTLSTMMARQIEHSERQSLELSDISQSVDIYKDGIANVEKIERRLNEIEATITNLETEIEKCTQNMLKPQLTSEIQAIEDKLTAIPMQIDTSIDAMKYGIVDLVNTVMDLEKAHGLAQGLTFDKIENRIVEIETSIVNLAFEIAQVQRTPAAPVEIDGIKAAVAEICNRMEGAVVAVKDQLTAMENVSLAEYGKEVGTLKLDVASIRDALAEVMRFLLVLSE